MGTADGECGMINSVGVLETELETIILKLLLEILVVGRILKLGLGVTRARMWVFFRSRVM